MGTGIFLFVSLWKWDLGWEMGFGMGNGINLSSFLSRYPHSMIDCFAYNLNRLLHEIWKTIELYAVILCLNVNKKLKVIFQLRNT